MRASVKGFTLLELMIAVAVVAILATIAYPSYTEHVRKGRRTDAVVALTTIAQQYQRCFTTKMDYTECPAGPFTSENGYYEITVDPRTESTYTLTASPKDAQAVDTTCATFTLTHAGARAAKNSSNADTTADCWR